MNNIKMNNIEVPEEDYLYSSLQCIIEENKEVTITMVNEIDEGIKEEIEYKIKDIKLDREENGTATLIGILDNGEEVYIPAYSVENWK